MAYPLTGSNHGASVKTFVPAAPVVKMTATRVWGVWPMFFHNRTPSVTIRW